MVPSGWQRLWDPKLTSYNFTGFLAPFYANGTRNSSFDPTTCGECEWSAVSYEALPWGMYAFPSLLYGD